MPYPRLRFSIRTLLIAITLTGIAIVVWPPVWTQLAVYSVVRNVDREGGDFVRPAADAIAEYGSKSIPVFAKLLGHDNLYVRIVAVEKLGDIAPQEESVKALVAALRDSDFRVRMTAANMIWKMNELAEPFVPEIADCLSDDEPQVQVFAIQSLGRLAERGVNTTGSVAAMTQLSKDPMFSTVIRQALEKMKKARLMS